MSTQRTADTAEAQTAPEDQLPPLPVPDPVHDYEKIRRIGEGTYGVVCTSPIGLCVVAQV